MDSSRVALAKAQRLATERRVEIDFRYVNLAHWQWEPDAYDLVVAIFIQFADPALRAAIFAGMQQTLSPGGLLLLHGFTPAQLTYGTGGPPCAELLYTPELLRNAFAKMEILQLDEYELELQEGSGHAGQAALLDLVARLPVAAEQDVSDAGDIAALVDEVRSKPAHHR